MKKLLGFLRSMRFGMLLLVIILLLSVAGSLIVQGAAESTYAELYPGVHHLILGLGLDHIFSTWYFLLILFLLCANLTLCTIVRIGRVRKQAAAQVATAAAVKTQTYLDDTGAAMLEHHLKTRRYKRSEAGDAVVWHRNRVGYYGSFVTHLSILLVFVVGALVLYLADTRDVSVYPGDTLTLEDGTQLHVDSFRITDESGRLDFTSSIRITAPDGTEDGPVEIKVNYPHSFRSHKYYQQTYGTCGSVSVTDKTNGARETFTLDEICFLTVDGVNGLWYRAVYPGYIEDEQGNFTLITHTAGAYEDPIYEVLVVSEGANTPVLAFPGEELTVGDLVFTFNEPVSYPGIRIKITPMAFTALLYASFVLMIIGLWLSFFQTPVAITQRGAGYAISGLKTTGTRLELDALLAGHIIEPPTPEENDTGEDIPC